MELLVDFLREVQALAENYTFTKWELYGGFLVVVGVRLAPELLRHRREMEAIRLKFSLDSEKQSAKIADQRAKRARKAKRESE